MACLRVSDMPKAVFEKLKKITLRKASTYKTILLMN